MITTQPEPCWILSFPGGDVWEEPHFDCETDAQSEADDRNEGRVEAPYGVRELDHLCITAACNGCRKTVGDGDFACVHFPDVTLAAEMARESDFHTDGTDAWCDDCLPGWRRL